MFYRKIIGFIFFVFWLASPARGEVFIPERFTVLFEQVYVSELTEKTKTSFGKIDYQYPSKIRFEITKPDKIIFVSNEKKTWYYSAPFIEGESGELTVKPTGKTSPFQFFDKLRIGLVNNKYYKVYLASKRAKIIFLPKTAKNIGIISGDISFKNKSSKNFTNIASIKLLYNNKKEVTFNFRAASRKPKFKKSHFVFVPPANTKTSH